jgi:hypothetical protein
MHDRPRHRRPRQLRWAALAVLPLCSTFAACSNESTAEGTPTSAVTSTTTEGGLPEGAEELVGRWAHFDVVAYADESMNTGIISTGFADLELRDGELWNQMTFCHADTVTDQPIEVSISDAATQAILPVATPVEVTEVDGALNLIRPPTPTPIGIRLDDPANESLPDDPADPRIFDADGDGNPGVTSSVKVSEDLQGEIYLARREIFAYDVTQVEPDRLVGSITDSSEQLILGASNPAFMTPAQWVQVDDPALNPVIWVRVEPDWDCERLAQERDRLFPPNPEADW